MQPTHQGLQTPGQLRTRTSRARTGAITGFLFTSDPAVLTAVLWQNVITPAKLHTAFTYLTQNFPVAPLSQADFFGCCEAVVDSLDPAALPADLLVLAADFHPTEPPAGAVPAAAVYRRVAERRAGACCKMQIRP